jgi:hypothetical protein
VLWRLNENGILYDTDRLVAVSGGSIIAALVGLRWSELEFVEIESELDGSSFKKAENFQDVILKPLFQLTRKTIDVPSVLKGFLTPLHASDVVAGRYNDLLFENARLVDLPAFGRGPQIIILATDLRVGEKWVFSKHVSGTESFGYIVYPDLPISAAVAASSAFPPFLAPFNLPFDQDAVQARGWVPIEPEVEQYFVLQEWLRPGSSTGLKEAYEGEMLAKLEESGLLLPFRKLLQDLHKNEQSNTVLSVGELASLADGGILSNTGSVLCETSSKFIVSSASVVPKDAYAPPNNWLDSATRTMNLIHRRAENADIQDYAASLSRGHACTDPALPNRRRCGARVSLDTNVFTSERPGFRGNYAERLALAAIETRLKGLPDSIAQHLVNWGYQSALGPLVDADFARTKKSQLPFPETYPPTEKECIAREQPSDGDVRVLAVECE